MTGGRPRRRAAAAAAGLAVVVLGLAGCAPAGVVRGWRAPRWDAAAVGREARLLRMADTRRPDTLLLDTLLGDADAGRRARAALAVGQLRVRARYAVLRGWLALPDTAVAATAAFALGIGRDTAAVAVLAEAVDRGAPTVAAEAAWALGELGEPARPVIERALRPGGPCPGAALARLPDTAWPCPMLLLAAAKLRPVPAALVIPWLRAAHAPVVRAAAYALARTRVPDGVGPALALATHPDEEVRQHVARLAVRPLVPDSLVARARAALTALAADASERVRANAARSLATYGESAREAWWPLLADPARNVRVAAMDSAHLVLGADTAAWRRAWEADTGAAVRRPLAALARRVGVPLPALPSTPPREGAGVRPPLPATWGGIGAMDRPLADYERIVRQWVRPGAPQPRAVIETDHGPITVQLLAREAPLVVEAFLHLASAGYYRDTRFHRVVPNFVVQDGDITGGSGDRVGFTLRESWTRQRHGRGCLGLATAGPDTGGSQFYLCHSSQPHLDGAYTVFGRVIDGLAAMDAVVQGDRMRRVIP